MSGIFQLIRARLYPPPDPTESFEGKTVLLTGANSGLGFEAGIKFLKLGASALIIGSRSLESGNLAKAELEKRANRPDAVHVWLLDMNSFSSVLKFAERVNKEIPKLHVVLLNAGVLHRAYHVSPEGWEETLQVNTLSTALLAVLLLPRLKDSSSASDAAHLTAVSSQQFTRVAAKDLSLTGKILHHWNDPMVFQGIKAYKISKLLLEYVFRTIAELTRNEDGSLRLVVNSASPGYCVSSLGRQYNRFYERWGVQLINALLARTAEQGSRVLVSATVQGVESHGKCWRGEGEGYVG